MDLIRNRGRTVAKRRRGMQSRGQRTVSDEIGGTIIDYIISHGLSLREAEKNVQPYLSCSTVASMVKTF